MNEDVKSAGESLNALAGGQAVITTLLLQTKGACGSNVERFRALFGASVVVTEENALKALDMDFSWAAESLLPPHYKRYRDTMDNWYNTWCDKYRDEVQPDVDAIAALRTEFDNKLDAASPIDEEWERVRAEYREKLAEAREALDRKRKEMQAIWFARLYREACGITTDEWQIKEKDDGARRTADADADTTATEGPTAIESEAVASGSMADADPSGATADSDLSVSADVPAGPAEGGGHEV